MLTIITIRRSTIIPRLGERVVVFVHFVAVELCENSVQNPAVMIVCYSASIVALSCKVVQRLVRDLHSKNQQSPVNH